MTTLHIDMRKAEETFLRLQSEAPGQAREVIKAHPELTSEADYEDLVRMIMLPGEQAMSILQKVQEEGIDSLEPAWRQALDIAVLVDGDEIGAKYMKEKGTPLEALLEVALALHKLIYDSVILDVNHPAMKNTTQAVES